MRLYWKMLLPATMMSSQYTALTSATGTHNLQKGLPTYADRPDLPSHRIFEQRLRLSLTASVATRLDFSHEFIDVRRFPRPAPRSVRHVLEE
jgi:hypothetical protein